MVFAELAVAGSRGRRIDRCARGSIVAAVAYKHEEVAKTPAGYRVRSVKRGSHVVRVAFPPGPRRKGAGKVVEILHPKSETNPSCIVSNQARTNPGELLIFGNPSIGGLSREQAKVLLHKHLTGDFPARKWSTIKSLIDGGYLEEQGKNLVVTRKGKTWADEHHMEVNPSLSPSDERDLTKLWHTARIAGANTFGERITWAAKEWDKSHPGQRMRAYKFLSSAMRGYGNPERESGTGKFLPSNKPTATIKQVASKYFVLTMGGKEIGSTSRARAERHARAAGYTVKYENPKRKKNVTGVGPGSWVHTPGRSEVYRVVEMQGGAGHWRYLLEGPYPSKARVWTRTGRVYLASAPNSSLPAKRATRERAARIRGARLNPKRAELKRRIKALEAKFYPAMDRLAAARRAGGVMSPEYMAIEKETDKLSHDLDLARRQHGAAFNPSKMQHGLHIEYSPANAAYFLMWHGTILRIFPTKAEAKQEMDYLLRGTKESQQNPGKVRVFFDKGLGGSWVATVFHQKYGNLFASGQTKEEARAKLKERVEHAERTGTHRNPPQHVGDHQGVAMYFEGISYNAPSLKLYGYSTDLALKRAIDRKLKTRRNPGQTDAAVRLFEKFHGRDPKEITEKHVSAAMRKDYTALGDLEYLMVCTPLGQTVKFQFEGDGVKLASSPDGKQLYCIGGNQNLTSCLTADSLEKDFVDLGTALQVQYLARKVHANFEPTSYYHKFGEKTGARPQLMYDKLKRNIFFVGGEYFIDTKHGVSPGIEN